MTKRLTTKKPSKASSKKVSAVRRQSSVLVSGAVPEAQVEVNVSTLVRDIGEMIDAARKHVTVNANTTLVTLHWQVGNRVHTEVLDERRAVYGTRYANPCRRLRSHFAGRAICRRVAS